jgi:AcrR family transcriptional regulator
MTKEKILAIATEEFSKYGYDAVSMNNLAQRLDVNKATIYYHYKDKKSLYQEVVKSLLEDNIEKIEEVMSSYNDPIEMFRAYISTMVKKFKDRPFLVQLVLREFANFGSNIDNEIIPYLNKETGYIKQIIENLDLKDKYKDMDVQMIESMIIGTVSTYFSFQASGLEVIGLKDLGNDNNRVLEYTCECVTNVLIDALCK